MRKTHTAPLIWTVTTRSEWGNPTEWTADNGAMIMRRDRIGGGFSKPWEYVATRPTGEKEVFPTIGDAQEFCQ